MEPPTIFYFQYQMKVEFIPCISEEILLFLSHFQKCLPNTQLALKMLGLLRKKIRSLDEMYYRYWNDFRINLLLPAKDALLQFYERHRQDFATMLPTIEQDSPTKGAEKGQKRKKANLKVASPLKAKVTTQQNASNLKSKGLNPPVKFAPPLEIRTAESNYHSSQALSLSYVNEQPSPLPHKKVILQTLKKMSKEEFINYLRQKQK